MARIHHPLFAAFARIDTLAPATGCRKREVCGGRGMVVDSRPLVGVLSEIGTPPEATICKGSSSTPEDDKFAETHRLVELGKNANEGFDRWKKHLESKGWKETTPLLTLAKNAEIETSAVAGKQRSDCGTTQDFTKAGVPGKFMVGVSYCAEGWKEVAWTNVTYLKN